MKTRLLLILIFSSIHAAAFAGSRTNFLSHGPSVAACGRGEAASACLLDISASYYNPALLAAIRKGTFGLSHYMLYEGSMYDFIGTGVPLGNTGFIGMSAINLKSGDVEIRQAIDDTPETINTNHWALIVSGAKHFSGFGANAGLNIKYVYQDMYEYSGGGIGLDLGVSKEVSGPRFSETESRLNIGFTVQNLIEPRVTLVSEPDTYARIYRLGAALNVPVYSRAFSYDILALYADLVSEDGEIKYFTGLEYRLFDRYIFRAGYYKDHATLGAGYKHKNIQIDYAIDLGELANFHRFGLSFYWGKAKEVRNLLMDEAQAALKKSQKEKAKREKKILPLFKSAKRDFKKKRYIKATEKFERLMLQYPDYEIAREYYQKIVNNMNITAESRDLSDLEELSYARGYLYYRGNKLYEAINEWEKVLQLNPKREEIKQYKLEVESYLKDQARRKKEKEIEDKVKNIYNNGTAYFKQRKWVSSIKAMEEVQSICRAETFLGSLDWHNKAAKYIEKAVEELSRLVKPKPRRRKPRVEPEPEPEPEVEIDVKGAQQKYNEGLILFAQGKISDAIRLWRIALRLNPNHKKAGKAIQRAQEKQNGN